MNSDEDDIEMIGFEDLEDGARQKLLPQQKNVEEREEREEEEGDETTLLNGSHERRERSAGVVQRFWPQVKDIVIETAPTLLLITVGLLFTGELLDKVSRWTAMQEVHQLIIIIPVVMNLKGNLEMNLSARLATAANVGDLDDPAVRRSMILGNLSLLQVQATVVSFVAACIALLIGLALPRIIPDPSSATDLPVAPVVALSQLVGHNLIARRPIPPIRPDYSKFTFRTLVIVSSTAMTAACLASMVLGSFMCALIVLCRRFNRDPDNIAPPIASFLGDLVSLCFIGVTATVLVSVINTPIPLLVAALVLGLATVCLFYTVRNDHVRPLLRQGWSPLFGAMVISCGTGIVLDRFVSRFEGFALLALVISGLPGSVGCILASRLSTSLHAAALSITPVTAGGCKRPPSTTVVMITLLCVTLPIEVVFLVVVRALGWLNLPFIFLILSILFFLVAVVISLGIAHFLTNFLWSRHCDPDEYALPLHSALMDLVGQMLLAICFEIVIAVTRPSKAPS